jgi:hypothetical protein
MGFGSRYLDSAPTAPFAFDFLDEQQARRALVPLGYQPTGFGTPPSSAGVYRPGAPKQPPLQKPYDDVGKTSLEMTPRVYTPGADLGLDLTAPEKPPSVSVGKAFGESLRPLLFGSEDMPLNQLAGEHAVNLMEHVANGLGLVFANVPSFREQPTPSEFLDDPRSALEADMPWGEGTEFMRRIRDEPERPVPQPSAADPESLPGITEARANAASDPSNAGYYMAEWASRYQVELSRYLGVPLLESAMFVPTTDLGQDVMRGAYSVGMPGLVTERMYAGSGMRNVEETVLKADKATLPAHILAIRERWDAGFYRDRDEMLDDLALNNAGFANDPTSNLFWAIVLDPLNVSLAGGLVSRASKVVGFMPRMRLVNIAVARYAATHGEAAKLALLEKVADDIAAEAVARGGKVPVGDTMATMRRDPNRLFEVLEREAPEELKAARASLTSKDRAMLTLEPALQKVADVANVINEPLSFFGKGPVGKRIAAFSSRGSTEGVVHAYGPTRVLRMRELFRKVLPDTGDGIFASLLGRAAANVEAAVKGDDIVRSSLAVGAEVPNVNPNQSIRAMAEVESSLLGRQVESFMRRIMTQFLPSAKVGADAGAAEIARIRSVSLQRLKAMLEGTVDEAELLRFVEAADDEMLALIEHMYYSRIIERFLNSRTAALRSLQSNVTLARDALAHRVGPRGTAKWARRLKKAEAQAERGARFTLIGPRHLTYERAGKVLQAVRDGDANAVREFIDRYDQLSMNFAAKGLTDEDLLIDVEKFLVDLRGTRDSGSSLVRVPKRSELPAELRDLVDEERRFARAAGLSEDDAYTVGLMPDEENLWRAVYDDETGRLVGLNPWVDVIADEAKDYSPSRFMAARDALMRPIRGQRLVEEAKRRFHVYGTRAGLSRSEAIALFSAIRGLASERGLMPRGLSSMEIYRMAEGMNIDKFTLRRIGERGLARLVALAYEGEVGTVGLTQKISGKMKSERVTGEWTRIISEKLYPLVRFRYNPIFIAQETVEPFFWNLLRGIKPGIRWSDEDIRIWEAMRRAGLISEFEDQWEWSAAALIGAHAAHEVAGPTSMLAKAWSKSFNDPRTVRSLAELKRLNYVRETGRLHADYLHKALNSVNPGVWDGMAAELGTTNKVAIANHYWLAKAFYAPDDPRAQLLLMDASKPEAMGRVATVRAAPLARLHDFASPVEMRRAIRAPVNPYTEAQFMSRMTAVGADPDYARRAWLVASFISVDDFYRAMRKVYLETVAGGDGRTATSLARQTRALHRSRAQRVGRSEEELLATTYKGEWKRLDSAGSLPREAKLQLMREQPELFGALLPDLDDPRVVGLRQSEQAQRAGTEVFEGKPKPVIPARAHPPGLIDQNVANDLGRVYGQEVEGHRVITPDDPRLGPEVYHVTTRFAEVQRTGRLVPRSGGGFGSEPFEQRSISLTHTREKAEMMVEDFRFVARYRRLMDEGKPQEAGELLRAEGERQGMDVDLLESEVFEEFGDRADTLEEMMDLLHREAPTAETKESRADRILGAWFWTRHQSTGRRGFAPKRQRGVTIDEDDVGIVAVTREGLRDSDALLIDYTMARRLDDSGPVDKAGPFRQQNTLDELRAFGPLDVVKPGEVEDAVSWAARRFDDVARMTDDELLDAWLAALERQIILDRAPGSVKDRALRDMERQRLDAFKSTGKDMDLVAIADEVRRRGGWSEGLEMPPLVRRLQERLEQDPGADYVRIGGDRWAAMTPGPIADAYPPHVFESLADHALIDNLPESLSGAERGPTTFMYEVEQARKGAPAPPARRGDVLPKSEGLDDLADSRLVPPAPGMEQLTRYWDEDSVPGDTRMGDFDPPDPIQNTTRPALRERWEEVAGYIDGLETGPFLLTLRDIAKADGIDLSGLPNLSAALEAWERGGLRAVLDELGIGEVTPGPQARFWDDGDVPLDATADELDAAWPPQTLEEAMEEAFMRNGHADRLFDEYRQAYEQKVANEGVAPPGEASITREPMRTSDRTFTPRETGTALPIDHPDLVDYVPNGRRAVITDENDRVVRVLGPGRTSEEVKESAYNVLGPDGIMRSADEAQLLPSTVVRLVDSLPDETVWEMTDSHLPFLQENWRLGRQRLDDKEAASLLLHDERSPTLIATNARDAASGADGLFFGMNADVLEQRGIPLRGGEPNSLAIGAPQATKAARDAEEVAVQRGMSGSWVYGWYDETGTLVATVSIEGQKRVSSTMSSRSWPMPEWQASVAYVGVADNMAGQGYASRLYDAIHDTGRWDMSDLVGRSSMTPQGKEFAKRYVRKREAKELAEAREMLYERFMRAWSHVSTRSDYDLGSALTALWGMGDVLSGRGTVGNLDQTLREVRRLLSFADISETGATWRSEAAMRAALNGDVPYPSAVGFRAFGYMDEAGAEQMGRSAGMLPREFAKQTGVARTRRGWYASDGDPTALERATIRALVEDEPESVLAIIRQEADGEGAIPESTRLGITDAMAPTPEEARRIALLTDEEFMLHVQDWSATNAGAADLWPDAGGPTAHRTRLSRTSRQDPGLTLDPDPKAAGAIGDLRAEGIEVDPPLGAFTRKHYEFMTSEYQRMAGEFNAEEWMGRTDWTPAMVQAMDVAAYMQLAQPYRPWDIVSQSQRMMATLNLEYWPKASAPMRESLLPEVRHFSSPEAMRDAYRDVAHDVLTRWWFRERLSNLTGVTVVDANTAPGFRAAGEAGRNVAPYRVTATVAGTPEQVERALLASGAVAQADEMSAFSETLRPFDGRETPPSLTHREGSVSEAAFEGRPGWERTTTTDFILPAGADADAAANLAEAFRDTLSDRRADWESMFRVRGDIGAGASTHPGPTLMMFRRADGRYVARIGWPGITPEDLPTLTDRLGFTSPPGERVAFGARPSKRRRGRSAFEQELTEGTWATKRGLAAALPVEYADGWASHYLADAGTEYAQAKAATARAMDTVPGTEGGQPLFDLAEARVDEALTLDKEQGLNVPATFIEQEAPPYGAGRKRRAYAEAASIEYRGRLDRDPWLVRLSSHGDTELAASLRDRYLGETMARTEVSLRRYASEAWERKRAEVTSLPPPLQNGWHFSTSKRGVKGAVYRDPSDATGRAQVFLTKDADAGTILHELFHVFEPELEDSMRLRILEAYSKATGKRYVAKKWHGRAEEWFADQFALYVREGQADTPALQSAFNAFGRYIDDVVGKGAPGVSPEVKAILDDFWALPGKKTGAVFDPDEHRIFAAARHSMQAAEDEAFTTHYFRRGRSLVERSLNHPYLGMYPASYMWGKVVPELIRFLVAKPFGVDAPLWGMAQAVNVWQGVALQFNVDPELRKWVQDHPELIRFMTMLLPGSPWDVPVNAPAWARHSIATVANNKERVERGLEPKGTDVLRSIGETADYAFNPGRALTTASSIIDELFGPATEEQPSVRQRTQPVFDPIPGELREAQQALSGMQ